MYRIVASDMDETFLARDGSVPPANVAAIRSLRAAGCLFVPSSGRPYSSVMDSISSVPAELMEGSYVLSFNGACLNRYGDATPLMTHSLPFEKVSALFDYAATLGVGVHVYELSGVAWGTRLSADERAYVANRLDIRELGPEGVAPLADVPLAKILYVRPDMAYLRSVAAAMPAELLEGVDITFSSGRYLEFVPRGVNKGAGLAALAGRLGVDMADTVGCGDSDNDLALLQAAGLGVAVANASPELRATADLVTSADCDEGLLPEVAERVRASAPAR